MVLDVIDILDILDILDINDMGGPLSFPEDERAGSSAILAQMA
jgi:hypothetical protein